MPNLPHVGAAKGGLAAARTAVNVGGHLIGVKEPFHRFWVLFSGAVQAERLDLPWDVVRDWRLSPRFHGAAAGLLEGDPAARGKLIPILVGAARHRPDGSRYDSRAAAARMMELAERAAAQAVADPSHPAKLALQQQGLWRAEMEEVRTAVEQVTHPVRELTERLDRLDADNRRTQEMLAEVLAALSVSGYAEVRPAPVDPVVANQRLPDDLIPPGRARELRWTPPKPRERAALRYASKLAALPDVRELLVVDTRTMSVVAGHRKVYADLVVTDDAAGRWLADLKRNPGNKIERTARARFAQEALDAAGGGWRWVALTPADVASATSWRTLVTTG